MKIYARIDSGIVVEFFETDGDITQMFHPDMEWIDVSNEDLTALRQSGEPLAIVNGHLVLLDPSAPSIEDPRVDMKCTAYQIRQALSAVGLRDQVEAAVAAGDQALKDAWQYAQTFERLHPKIVQIGVALGQTDAQLDDLFTLGMTLQP
jgi:catalase (peroxidase I)